jgi:hypothetical protein
MRKFGLVSGTEAVICDKRFLGEAEYDRSFAKRMFKWEDNIKIDVKK